MHPAPIVMADRTRKKNYWRTVSDQHCLLAEGDIGAPIYWRSDAPTPILLADQWFHTQSRQSAKLFSNRRNWERLCPSPGKGVFSAAGEGLGADQWFHTQSRQSAKLFSNRRNWDSPNPSPAAENAPFPGEGHSRSQFRRGDMNCGTL